MKVVSSILSGSLYIPLVKNLSYIHFSFFIKQSKLKKKQKNRYNKLWWVEHKIEH